MSWSPCAGIWQEAPFLPPLRVPLLVSRFDLRLLSFRTGWPVPWPLKSNASRGGFGSGQVLRNPGQLSEGDLRKIEVDPAILHEPTWLRRPRNQRQRVTVVEPAAGHRLRI
jgi:hypothetical protein